MNDLKDAWDSFEDEVLDDILGVEHIDDVIKSLFGDYGDDLQEMWANYFEQETGVAWDKANQPQDWEDLAKERLLPELKKRLADRVADELVLTGDEHPVVGFLIRRTLAALIGRKLANEILDG